VDAREGGREGGREAGREGGLAVYLALVELDGYLFLHQHAPS